MHADNVVICSIWCDMSTLRLPTDILQLVLHTLRLLSKEGPARVGSDASNSWDALQRRNAHEDLPL